MFIADRVERVCYRTLVPADYNPRQMDSRTLRVLVGSLLRFGWIMPVVVNRRTGNIVGGHQRARANAEVVKRLRSAKDRRAAEYERPPAIFVDVSLPVEKAMNVALNQISGDWDFFKRTAADQLRQNATYAQMRRKRLALGRGYKAPIGLLEFSFGRREHREAFRAFYGDRLLDFGAGGRQEIGWIKRSIGVDAMAFEPFPRERGKVSLRLARRLADGLLGRLERGWRPDTIVSQFVLSSIARPEDRRAVLTILAALADGARQVVVAVRSTDEARYREVLGQVRNKKSPFLGIPDAAEPGLLVTGAGTAKQQFQKFFGPDEIRGLCLEFFADVRQASLEERDSALVMVCRRPRSVHRRKLDEALRFEFELKIDGRRSADRPGRSGPSPASWPASAAPRDRLERPSSSPRAGHRPGQSILRMFAHARSKSRARRTPDTAMA